MLIKTKPKTQSPFKSVLKADKDEKVFFCIKLQSLLKTCIKVVDFDE